MAGRPQQLALARVADLDLPSDGGKRRPSASSTSSSELERLHDELQLEIKPQRLQRQYTLTVPPYSADGDRFSHSGILDATSDVLNDVLSRWEKNQVKWRRATSSDENQEAWTDNDGGNDSEGLVEKVQNCDTFDVTFGEGFLGLEFVLDARKNKVVVKNVHLEKWTMVALNLSPDVSITKGLWIDAVNGRSVSTTTPEDVLDMLQFSRRPMTLTFRRARKSVIVCKLCEMSVEASSLEEHANYCVLSKRVELEADGINNSLMKLTASINAMLAEEATTIIMEQELHLYHTLRVVAIQASTCDVTSVDAFALCARLVKIVDRLRQQDIELSTYAGEYGGHVASYCTKLRDLIHAKMSKVRASHKVMFQQAPIEEVRTPLKRTKSLENIDNSDELRGSRRSSFKSASCRVSIRDFHIVKPISKGAFGKVYLARKKTTGDQYAIKVLAKQHLLRKKQIQQIETERNILASVVSPFVVKLFWTFQNKRNLFLVMEYLPGGDFMSLLECIVQLEEQVACVYIAEIAIALNHLHSKGCVHRDLKPDNILLSSSGHIKLTDFGLSEEAVAISDTDSEPDDDYMVSDADNVKIASVDETLVALEYDRPRRTISSKKKKSAYHTYGRCGTPDYLAPEIILGVPHGPPVDYWALGIILYEMLVGFPPFNDDTVDAIFNNIIERQILWPDGEKCLSAEAMDLIDKLLDPDPATRMSWDGIKLHPFFNGINWDTILESVPPFVPTLEGPNDTSYFNNRNLTDIFIDDDDFDDASPSASNCVDNLDFGTESDQQNYRMIDGNDTDNHDFENNALSKTAAADSTWGIPETLDVHGGLGNCREKSIGDGALNMEDNNSHFRFPSGMYGSPDESNLADAFKSFSFTNMNALAAASQAEAGILTDTEKQHVGAPSGPSILI
ncbi:putative rho-associated protein kinase [Plasmopara halstedii]